MEFQFGRVQTKIFYAEGVGRKGDIPHVPPPRLEATYM